VAAVASRWLPEEEDSQAADRVGPPICEGEVVGQAGLEGQGERWATAGPEIRNS
jgi:hypothetical protein